MKATNNADRLTIQTVCALLFLVIANLSAFGQLPYDSSLVMWLKADAAAGSTQDQTSTNVLTVPLWTSSDSYATAFAVPPEASGYDYNDQSNHTPQLVMATNNGVVFKAVQFRQENDPTEYGTGHMADRLWQTNNLGEDFTGTADPCDIATTNDMTLFVVYQNTQPITLGSVYQCIMALRSATACPYSLYYVSAADNYQFFDTAGIFALGSAIPVQADGTLQWGLIEMNLTAGGTLTMKEYSQDTLGWQTYSETGVPRESYNPGDPVGICIDPAGISNPALAYERFAGYLGEMALYNRSLNSNELANAENYLLAKYFLQPGPPQITTQPQNETVNVFTPASFTVLPDGTPPFTYQWLKNNQPIPGANAATYSIASTVATNSGNYSVIVSNSISFIQSSNAVLTVIVPTAPPAISTADLEYTNDTEVVVTFDEEVTPQTATNAGNYSLNNGGTVTAATALSNPADTNYITSVVLTTSPITTQSVLTARGIVDQFGNTAANATATILVPVAAGSPPSANLLMWLAADTGLSLQGSQVVYWSDQSGYPNDHDASYLTGNVQLEQTAFPNGMHPSLDFDGASVLQVDNPTDFQLQNFTIYLVGDLDASQLSDDFICYWEGFGLGGSDSTKGAVKWCTWGITTNGTQFSQFITTSPVLGNRVPTLIEATFANPGNQTLDFDGSQVEILANTSPIDYVQSPGLPFDVAIGALYATTSQCLVGDIQEILFYSNVSAAQDAAVQSYLTKKYFSPSLTLPTLVSATASGTPSTTVSVVFSEAVSAATATNVLNYAIDNGATVSAASMVNSNNVILTTSTLGAGQYTLSVSGVSDWAGNAIAAGSQVAITGLASPSINIVNNAGTISLTWSAGAPYKLQSATAVSGPWSDVAGATSPYSIPATGLQQYYRLSNQ